jgi:hypothetical protein
MEILAARDEARVLLVFMVTDFFSFLRAMQDGLRADGRYCQRAGSGAGRGSYLYRNSTSGAGDCAAGDVGN